MEKFNLDKWLANPSRKVVTRDGRTVRILDYNLKGDKHICIAVDDETQESITTVDEDGHCLRDKTGWHESDFDLFFADKEEELTELQKTLEEDCDCYVNLYNDGKTREELRQWIKAWCPRIIDLAKKELEEDYYLCAKDDSLWEDGYKNGKQDALKDLPKLEKTKDCIDPTIPIMYTNTPSMKSYVEYHGYKLCINDVFEKLPKEE